MPVILIGVDADDTLWHNESYFRVTQARFAELLAPFAPAEASEARLAAVEKRNLALYGYAQKASPSP
jgi:putative hydrolase of the HAD superfamily